MTPTLHTQVVIQILNRDLDNLRKWLIVHKLTLNTTKTEFMLMGSRQKVDTLSGSIELSVNDVPVKQTSTVKSLTVLIDETLTW